MDVVRRTAAAVYLEALFELSGDDIELLQARLAERLEVSRPALSEMVRRLRDGLVEVEDRRLLVDVFGLGWAEAHEVAGSWQRVIDDRTEAAIIRLLDSPTTCPHGNPIPGSGYDGEHLVPLADLGAGETARVERVTEQLEVEPGMLVGFERVGLIPGVTVRIESVSPDGSVAVNAPGGVLAMAATTARGILVTTQGGTT